MYIPFQIYHVYKGLKTIINSPILSIIIQANLYVIYAHARLLYMLCLFQRYVQMLSPFTIYIFNRTLSNIRRKTSFQMNTGIAGIYCYFHGICSAMHSLFPTTFLPVGWKLLSFNIFTEHIEIFLDILITFMLTITTHLHAFYVIKIGIPLISVSLSHRGTHGSINYGPIRVLFFNWELRITDHYLRPLSESYINI